MDGPHVEHLRTADDAPASAPAIHAPASGRGRDVLPWLLVAPMVAGLAVFALYPLIYLVFLSASKSLLGKTFQEWVGWENFQRALADSVFTDSLVRSAVFAISVSLVELVFGVAIALLLLGFIRSGSLWRTLILLPLMTPPIVVAKA